MFVPRSAPSVPPSWRLVPDALVQIAATASGAAGLVHASAAGSHSADRTLSVIFAITATIQLSCGLLFASKPSRLLAIATFAVNSVFVLAWMLSRTVGLPITESLRQVEHVSTQDAVAAVLGIVAAFSAGAAAWRHHHLADEPRPSRRSVAIAGCFVIAAIPGMSAVHGHGNSPIGTDHHTVPDAPVNPLTAGTDLHDH